MCGQDTIQRSKKYVQALIIKDKKRKLLQEKLSENIGKPEELSKIKKKKSSPNKKAPAASICLNTKKELTFSPRTITNIFKKDFANLASGFVKKHSDTTGKF